MRTSLELSERGSILFKNGFDDHGRTQGVGSTCQKEASRTRERTRITFDIFMRHF